MVRNLQRICDGEGFTCEPAALEMIARSATGSHRDAVNLLDQLATSYGNDLTVEHARAGLGLIGDARAGELARLALNADLAGGLTLISAVRDDGLDLRQFQKELVDELRALLMVKNGIEPSEGATQERMQELREAVKDITTAQVLTALRAFGEADLKTDPNSTLPLDIALAECALQGSAAGAPAQSQTVSAVAPPQATSIAPAAPQPTRAAPAVEPVPARPETPLAPSPEPVAVVATPEPANDVVVEATPDTATEPAPQPVRVTAGLADSSSLEAAKAQMRAIYEKARAAGFQLGALLNSGCDIIEADESAIVIGFKHPNHADKVSEKPNLDALAAIVSVVMGRPLSVRCVHEPSVEPWSQRTSAAGSSLVQAAQEMGGRILSSGPEDQP